MDKCIPLINKLQEVQTKAQLRNSPIQLPQIVVVGSQSSGKSSVLESFVGYPFLPRGAGIVTRRPLILQLVQTFPGTERPKKAKASGFWAKFNHKNKYLTDYDDVLNEIQHETDKVAGENKGISNEPILLTVYSDKVVNLTVVDLPGITKVPVGDQPEDIEHQIRELIVEYITNENSIILAVSAANTDMATSEAVKMAKEVDPSGERTLAVITKLDLMDKGTDATDCLEGRVIPVKLGIIGVINRSQQDINNNKSIEDAMRDEKKFLEEKYPSLARKNGTTHLATTLSRLLVKHIEKCIPVLKDQIKTQIYDNKQKMLKYGEPVVNEHETTLHILKDFSEAYNQSLDGTSKLVDTAELKGGARISCIIHDLFYVDIDSIKPLENLDHKDMLIAMRNSTGIHTSLNVPQNVFTSLVSRQLGLLEYPSLNCLNMVHAEMTSIIKNCEDQLKVELSRFPKLKKKIRDVVVKLLESRLRPAESMVKDLINMEKAFININHPQFQKKMDKTELEDVNSLRSSTSSSPKKEIGEELKKYSFDSSSGYPKYISSKISPKTTGGSSFERFQKKIERVINSSVTKPTQKNNQDICDIELLIDTYFRIIRRDIKDKVPKAVMYTLVNYVKDNLHANLLANLYRQSDESLLQENPQIEEERKHIAKIIQALEESADILEESEEEMHCMIPAYNY